jgi:hypothetical protein
MNAMCTLLTMLTIVMLQGIYPRNMVSLSVHKEGRRRAMDAHVGVFDVLSSYTGTHRGKPSCDHSVAKIWKDFECR